MTQEKRNEVFEAAANFVINELNKENEKSPVMISAIAELIKVINPQINLNL